MKYLHSLLLLFLFAYKAISQNLIPNPGFELCQKCDATGFAELNVGQGANIPIDWNAASGGTPDFRSNQPHTGKKHGGFYLGYGKYEYLTTHLLENLKPGAKYKVQFYLSPDKRFPTYALDKIGIAFVEGAPNYPNKGVVNQIPVAYETPDNEFITDFQYNLYSFEYTACGNEDHIIIGRFTDQMINDTMFIGTQHPADPSNSYIYYVVDDVSMEYVSHLDDILTEKKYSICPGESVSININTKYAQANIKWSTGSASNSINVNSPGDYWVEIQTDTHCPAIRDSFKVSLKNPPTIYINGVDKLCDQQSATLMASADQANISFVWDNKNPSPNYQVNGPGTYQLTAKWECGEVQQKYTINSFDKLTKISDLIFTLCNNKEIDIHPPYIQSKDCEYLWSDGTMGYMRTINLLNSYSYQIKCPCESYEGDVIVMLCDQDLELKFPNTIIATGSDENKKFGPYFNSNFKSILANYNMKIYNRWGQKIFESTNIDDFWKPELNDLVETYSYIVNVSYQDKLNLSDKVYKGVFTYLK